MTYYEPEGHSRGINKRAHKISRTCPETPTRPNWNVTEKKSSIPRLWVCPQTDVFGRVSAIPNRKRLEIVDS
jgi:hypothetical protein